MHSVAAPKTSKKDEVVALMRARHGDGALARFVQAQKGVRALIELVGEQSSREGLRDTPDRVCGAYVELTSGYEQDPATILSTRFSLDDVDDIDGGYHGAVALRNIEFVSLCEHHMLPFMGIAHVIYIPGSSGSVVGLSKLARLVDCYAKRLQVQERLTKQIAHSLSDHLKPKGVAVRIEATHLCMQVRGVTKQNATMVTTEMLGSFRDDARARAEAIGLFGGTAR